MMDAEEVRRMTEIEQRGKSNTRRIEGLEHRQSNLERLTETVATMQAELKNVLVTVSETKDAVHELQEKPGKRWEALIAAVLSALAGVAIGMLFK